MDMNLPTVILDTIVAQIARFFLAAAKGDPAAARQAAATMLAARQPQTADELCLAAQIVSFSFHALEALGQATTPDMPLTRILRLRGSAVSLSRESHKAQRRLDDLQAARRANLSPKANLSPRASLSPKAGLSPQQAEPQAPSSSVEKAIALITDTQNVADLAKTGKVTWTQAYNQRQRDKNLAARQQKIAARQGATAPPAAAPNGLDNVNTSGNVAVQIGAVPFAAAAP